MWPTWGPPGLNVSHTPLAISDTSNGAKSQRSSIRSPMAVEQEGCQFYVMLSLFPITSHDLRYQDENTRLMTTRLLMKIKANKANPDCIIYSMWYLLIHCAIGRMIPRRFDLFAACYLSNWTTFSVDGQQEWCRWLCNISAVTSVGKWPILGIF